MENNYNQLPKFYFKSCINRKTLPLHTQRALSESEQQLSFQKNQIIYSEGNFPKGVYIIERGVVKASRSNENGSVQIVYFYMPGEIFGYRQLLCNEQHPLTTSALNHVILKFIGADDFLNILQGSKELGRQFLFMLGKEFSMWINRINAFAQFNVRQRLALSLLILNEKFKREKSETVTIELSKTDLARYVATSVEGVVRLLKEFEAAELVTVHGKRIRIKNFRQLYAQAFR